MGVGFFLEIIATTNPQLKIFPVWAISSKNCGFVGEIGKLSYAYSRSCTTSNN